MSAHAKPSSRAEPRHVHEKSNRVLDMFFNQRIDLDGKNNDTSKAEAREIALMLITRPNLPLSSRFHTHVVLACGEDDRLYHLQEAKRMIDMDRELSGLNMPPEVRVNLAGLLNQALNQARKLLRRNERASAELKCIEEGPETGTVGKTKRGADAERNEVNHLRISRAEVRSPTSSQRKSKVKARRILEDSKDDKNFVDEAKQVKVEFEIEEVPQIKVEGSTRTKSKVKRKACSSSDDGGVEENVVDGKKYRSS